MKQTLLILWLLGTIAVGCNTAVPQPEPAPVTQPTPALATPATNNQPNTAPRATVTPAEPATGYPAPAQPASGYPAAAEPMPRSEAYPLAAGYVWMIRPAGKQCAETPPPTLAEAIAELSAAGIEPLAPQTANLMVCEACDCPTSLHFWAQIPEDKVKTAESAGWTIREP